MTQMKLVLVAVMATAAYCMSPSLAMAKDEVAKTGVAAPKVVKNDAVKISNASKAIKEIAAIQKRKIPPALLKGCSAIVIVPKAAKHDFMVSGGSAGGVLLVRNNDGTWSSPVFISLSGGTLGWQILGDPMDIVLLIKNKKSVEAILKGKFTLDTKVAVEPGHLGPSMKGASAAVQKAEIVTYVRSHGVFADEAAVASTTLQIADAANDAFYATPKVSVGDIVSGKVVKSTEDVKALQKILTDYAAAK